jgi:hypothetical protein
MVRLLEGLKMEQTKFNLKKRAKNNKWSGQVQGEGLA